MNNADYIIAVNSDPHAPVFNIAHLGLVGDIYEILSLVAQAYPIRKGRGRRGMNPYKNITEEDIAYLKSVIPPENILYGEDISPGLRT